MGYASQLCVWGIGLRIRVYVGRMSVTRPNYLATHCGYETHVIFFNIFALRVPIFLRGTSLIPYPFLVGWIIGYETQFMDNIWVVYGYETHKLHRGIGIRDPLGDTGCGDTHPPMCLRVQGYGYAIRMYVHMRIRILRQNIPNKLFLCRQ